MLTHLPEMSKLFINKNLPPLGFLSWPSMAYVEVKSRKVITNIEG